MKIAVLGSTGMLGSMVAGYLGKNFEVVTPEFDAMAPDNGRLKTIIQDCQWVINAIGAIPQRCKDTPRFVALNANFPARLALAAENTGNKVIQIATDCIYDGKRGDYTEVDAASPTNHRGKPDIYADSKLQGEIISDNMFHLRCSIVGPETHGESLLGWFLNQPRGATIEGFINHKWNGITTLHFAKICEGIITYDLPLPPFQHVIPADSVSKYDLLQLFARNFGRDDITIDRKMATRSVYRTLATTDSILNSKLWALAGYPWPPTIPQMIEELREYVK